MSQREPGEGVQTIPLQDYMRMIEPTDILGPELRPVAMGLFGEVGSIMTAAKKRYRDKLAYVGYHSALEEEFGDTLWYFATLCRRLGLGVDEILLPAGGDGVERRAAASDLGAGTVVTILVPKEVPVLDDALVALGKAATGLLEIEGASTARERLQGFGQHYLAALQAAELTFSRVVRRNIEKARGRFLEPDLTLLPDFDSGFPVDEQIPRKFEIRITKRTSGRTYMQLNDVFIGDPLTDNSVLVDGYRFHDVFHIAHAAILHWSPVLRALMKHKRKSRSDIDEAQDGGRAIVVEEGLTAWVFSRAKQLALFEGMTTLSFDLLKTVQEFVAGYEVERCPLKLWETAILQGYDVFRQVRTNDGGIVVADREGRTVRYRKDDRRGGANESC